MTRLTIAVALLLVGCALDRSGLASDGDDAGRTVDAGGGACSAPSPEICNATDDDCDDTVDEDVARTCGAAVGACTQGTQTCSNGMWGACAGGVAPVEERCEGRVDDDCDGSVDEGCSCSTGEMRPCGSTAGACVAGSQDCVAELWQPCVGGTTPEVEICNRTDDDCDGTTDEEVTRRCGSSVGVCTRGLETCMDGSWGRCVGGVTPSSEVCEGMLDENCDGDVDEMCGCTDGTMSSCGSTVGVCTVGTRRCSGGMWGSCTGGVSATSETCNTLDDDCDGNIDEGGACPCPVRERAGHSYLFCTASVSWMEARNACSSFGYDLIILNDAAEDAFFVTEALGLAGGDWWIGASSGSDGVYYWVDGSPITYDNWKSGQPNGDDECVKADTSHSGEWDDKGCGGGRDYACESP